MPLGANGSDSASPGQTQYGGRYDGSHGKTRAYHSDLITLKTMMYDVHVLQDRPEHD